MRDTDLLREWAEATPTSPTPPGGMGVALITLSRAVLDQATELEALRERVAALESTD